VHMTSRRRRAVDNSRAPEESLPAEAATDAAPETEASKRSDSAPEPEPAQATAALAEPEKPAAEAPAAPLRLRATSSPRKWFIIHTYRLREQGEGIPADAIGSFGSPIDRSDSDSDEEWWSAQRQEGHQPPPGVSRLRAGEMERTTSCGTVKTRRG